MSLLNTAPCEAYPAIFLDIKRYAPGTKLYALRRFLVIYEIMFIFINPSQKRLLGAMSGRNNANPPYWDGDDTDITMKGSK